MSSLMKVATTTAVLVLLALFGSAEWALAQDETEELTDPADQQEARDAVDVESLLAGEDSMFAGRGYSYDAGERRDPFKSLLAARERTDFRGPKPEGIPGLLIDEIDLTGIFLTGEGPVAQIQSAEEDRSFLLRIGDQLYDGDVTDIRAAEVVFKQMIDDPSALKPFREVVKKLTP